MVIILAAITTSANRVNNGETTYDLTSTSTETNYAFDKAQGKLYIQNRGVYSAKVTLFSAGKVLTLELNPGEERTLYDLILTNFNIVSLDGDTTINLVSTNLANTDKDLNTTDYDDLDNQILTVDNEVNTPSYTAETQDYSSVVSVPSTVEGGELELNVDGATAVNAVSNGDFSNSTTGWGANNATQSVTDKVNTITVTSGTAFDGIFQTNTLSVGDKYFVAVDLYSDDIQNYLIGENANAISLSLSALSSWERLYGIQNVNASGDFTIYTNQSHTIGETFKVRNIIVIPMTGTPYENFTADQMNEAIPNFIDGVKSVDKFRIKSVSKNLFDKNKVIRDQYPNTSDGLLDPSGSNNNSSDFIPVIAGQTYTITNGFFNNVNSGVCFYDKSKNFISGINSSAQKTFIVPDGSVYARFTIPLANLDDDQFELGSTATTYEEYKETYVPCNLPLRQVPNGTADNFDANTGVHTKRVSDLDDISGTDYASIDTATYTNVDVVKTTAYTLAKDGTTGEDDSLIVLDSSGNVLEEVTQANIDLTASVGKFYYHTDNTIWFIVVDGTYADIAAARTGLGTSQVYYQLETPVTTQLLPKNLNAYENGTFYQEPYVEDVGVYATEITIVDTTLPVANLTHLNKIDTVTGNLEAIPLSDVTIAANGLTFTISGASAGEYYDYGYNYVNLSVNGEMNYLAPTNLKGMVDSMNKQIAQLNNTIEFQQAYMQTLEARIIALEP